MIATPEGKLPGAKKVADMDDVVLVCEEGSTKIEAHKCGYILYTQNGRSTVFTLEHCKLIPTETVEMSEENRKDYEEQGFKVLSWIVNGRKQNVICLTDDTFLDLDWTAPLHYVGESRLEHNANSREDYRSDFAMNGDGTDWDKHLWVPDFVEEIERQEEEEKKYIDERVRLHAAKKMLTERQQEIVKKHYYEDKTQQTIAEELGISQQAVSKTVLASLKNLRKNMTKMEKEK